MTTHITTFTCRILILYGCLRIIIFDLGNVKTNILNIALLENIFKKWQLIITRTTTQNKLYMYGVSGNSSTNRKIKYFDHFLTDSNTFK